MALSPLSNMTNEALELTVSVTEQPTKTYSLNFESHEIGSHIDGQSALRQFVQKTIATSRFRFLIYDDQYGCELEDLIGADVTDEYLVVEIPRLITDALIYDDRVADVTDFVITRKDDGVYIGFKVVATNGDSINEEVTI